MIHIRGGESGFEGRGKNAEESDTDDDDIIGPKPPTAGDSSSYLHSQVREGIHFLLNV